MKKLIVFIVTLVILLLANFAITIVFHQRFIDFSFIVGVLGAGVIRFFNSSGGFTSRGLDLKIQGQTGIKQEQQTTHFSPNVAFYTAIFYTIIAAIFTFLYYKDYFLN